MNQILKNKPVSRNSKLYNSLLYILTVLTAAPMLMPIVVYFQSGFTRVELSPAYLILRGISALCIILAVNIFVIKGNIAFFAIAGIFTAVTIIFPFAQCINDFVNQLSFSLKYNITIDHSQYILTAIEYLLFFVISVLTVLYSLGFFKASVIIMALSLPAAIASQYDVFDRALRFQFGLYEILCFAYAVTASLIPFVLVLASKNQKSSKSKTNNGKKYTPKRYA